jgi:heat shock protein HslJ/uncharacterized protein YecT (DUF1311 family)
MRSRTRFWMSLLLLAGSARAEQELSALRECTAASPTRTAVGPCLDRKLTEAEARLSAAAAAVRARMLDLDAATGRRLAASAFDRSQEAFAAFRERNCAWVSAQVGAGTGAGDVDRDCRIGMSRARTAELQAQLGVGGGAPAPGAPLAGGPAGLAGREWRLTRLVMDGQEVALVPGSAPSVQVDEAGTVRGNASINRFSRGYAVDASGTLEWSRTGFAMTRMAGSPELMRQEDRFLEALGRAVRLRVDGDTLVLEDGLRTTALTFERTERPAIE